MDRVSIRSFRAPELAERGLKDLARSRLDTTREAVFQPLGARFFEAREDAARIATLFREDAFHAPDGHFTRMALRVEPQLAGRLSAIDPRAVEARLAVRVVGHHELAVVAEAAREEAELPVHVPTDARRRAVDVVGLRRIRVDEHDALREGLAVHQIRVEELALGVQDDVEAPRCRDGQQGRDGEKHGSD